MIADRAGVSKYTVSRCLRNDRGNSAQTRARIQKLAQEMGYRPNPLVNALMTTLRNKGQHTESKAIALMYDWEEPLMDARRPFLEISKGYIERWGYRVEDGGWRGPKMPLVRKLDILHSRGVEGLLFLPPERRDLKLNADLSRFALARIGYGVASPNMATAAHNHFQGARLAFRVLRRRGYRRIGLLLEEILDERSNHQWRAAHYIESLSEPEDARLPALVVSYATHESAGARLLEWYRRFRPDAVIGSGPIWPALEEATAGETRDLGWIALTRRPELNAGPMAEIEQRHDLVLATAIDLLVSQLNRNERGPSRGSPLTLVPGEFVDGPTIRPEE